MTIVQLACFRCFVEEKSVTKAARRLYVTQPAVSQQLHLLAENMGCELFHRRGSHIELTPEGEFVYEKAKRILTELDGLRDELESRGSKVVGKVRVGSGQVAAKTILGDVVHDMSREYPEVSFSLLETNSSNLPQLILRSRIELGMGILPERSKGLCLEKLLTGRLVLVCSQENGLSSRASISRSELRTLNLIRHGRENTARRIAYDLYGKDDDGHGFRLEAMNTETIMSYVQRNMGVALATSYILEWLGLTGLATVELEEETEIPWGIMSDAARPLSKAATVLIGKLRNRFSTSSAGTEFGNCAESRQI
jgi:DNA-binding transcriptional LysR family regulator